MNQRIGLAVALALCLGVISIPAEAVQAEAVSSGETQPKKRKLAKTKAKKSSSKAKKADSKAPKGKKRKLAAADKNAGKKESTSSQAAAQKDAPKADAASTAKATPEATPAKAVSASTREASKDAAKSEVKSAKVADGAGKAKPSAKDKPAAPKTRKESAKSAKASSSAAPASPVSKDASSAPSSDAQAATSTAQPPAAPSATPSARPWADGVSQANQQQALRIFREGNGLLKQAVFAQAAIKYREALTYWDHPAIHYNLVLALLNLDRPTEVLEHLNKAMAYGAAPLDSEKFEQALQYKMLTERQLSRLVVRCDLEGAVVSMDGQELFVAPGKYEGYVRPGPHSIVAKKEGFMNSEISPSLVAGTLSEFDMVLIAAGDMTQYRRLWPNWRPWTVFGAGLAIAAVGVGLHLKGRSDVSSFDDDIDDLKTTDVVGETDNAMLGFKYEDGAEKYLFNEHIRKRDSGLRNQKIAMVMYGVGGAAIVTGAVLLYFNRLRPYTPETSTQLNPGAPSAAADKSPEVNVLPMLAPEAPGMMATVRF